MEDPAANPASGALEDEVHREQLLLLCRAMARAPVVNVIVVGAIAFIVWQYLPPLPIALWAALVLASELVRWRYARHVLAGAAVDARAALRNVDRIAFFVGCARGSAMPLFFSELPPAAHAALSVTFLGFCAGGLSTHGARARAFYLFAGPMMLALAVAWALSGTREGAVLVLLFILFALMITMFAREIERLFRDSLLIRRQRDRLVADLERERDQVALARDAAEQANRAKSSFLAAASHDLRQPLHALSLYTAALSLQHRDGPTRAVVDSIERASRSLTGLVDALLDISKLDAGAIEARPRAIRVDEVVGRVANDARGLALAKGLEFRVAGPPAVVLADPALLEQILRNLVDNAIKYTRAGEVRIESVADEQGVLLVVADTGRGIPEAERDRIFEEYYQVGNPERDRARGLGLGLAIVQRVARLMGLRVEVQSELERGSRFSLRLPAAREAAPEMPVLAPRDAAPLVGRRVLVVDDEREVRAAMCRLLEQWGCHAMAFGGLGEALAAHDREPFEIDALVADLRLRAGESGIEVIAALRRRFGPVHAVLVTGDTDPARLIESRASGLPVLHKPVSAQVLRAALFPAGPMAAR